jgi:hypothetical protein
MSSRVTDRDRGAKALMKRLAQSGQLTVGIHEAEGAATKEGDDDGGDMQLIDVAIVHEFGSDDGRIPRRSFIRDWEDEKAAEHKDQLRQAGKAVIDGKLDAERALGRLGVLYQGDIQKRIAAGIDPPLAQRTIDRKGSSKPLIDTGQLRTSVSHAVTVKK